MLHKCLQLLDLKKVHIPIKDGANQHFVDAIREQNKYPPPFHYRGNFHIPTVGPIPKKAAYRMKTKKHPRLFSLHWPYTEESEKIFSKYGKANFFMIRDPRDQMVSMVFMVHKNSVGLEAPFEEALLDLIDGGQRIYIPWAVEIQTVHPVMWENGIVRFYHLYIPWAFSKKFYTVRFENLIGPNGGGSAQAQFNEIRNIGRHLGVNLSQEKIQEITQNLFGGTFTFREGQIGSWKKYFTPKVKETFKNTPGACQLLIDLGYEKDSNW